MYKYSQYKAILIFVNGSDPRITVQMKYIATILNNVVSKNYLDNIFVFYSNTSTTPNLDIKDIGGFFSDLPQSNIFSYNNPLFKPNTIYSEIHCRLYKQGTETVKNLLAKIS